jgi:hypothetical protein
MNDFTYKPGCMRRHQVTYTLLSTPVVSAPTSARPFCREVLIKHANNWTRLRVANCLHTITCSICAPFSVARLIISGYFYHGSFGSVIESIVR